MDSTKMKVLLIVICYMLIVAGVFTTGWYLSFKLIASGVLTFIAGGASIELLED